MTDVVGGFYCDPSLPGDDPYSKRIMEIYREGNEDVFRRRRDLTLEFSWAIPSPDVISMIAKVSSDGLIEIGAGTGYWARLIADAGVDVVAFDKSPPGSKDKAWHSDRAAFHHVERATVSDVPWKLLRKRTLFMCWPPYMEDMGGDALQAFYDAGGETVVIISEGVGGCTGGESMWRRLGFYDYERCSAEQIFTEDESAFDNLSMPRWDGLNDYPTLWRRLDK